MRRLVSLEHTITARFISRVIIFVGALLSAQSVFAANSIMVGDGTPTSCTQQALQDALSTASLIGGANIRFDCGGGPVTIVLIPTTQALSGYPVALVPPDNTTIDGGGLVTLASAVASTHSGLFFVDYATSVTIKNLTIRPKQLVFFGVENSGALDVQNVAFVGSGSGEGEIAISNGGVLTVKNSTFSDFAGIMIGRAIATANEARIDHSAFLNNRMAIATRGTLDVKNSVFSGNGPGNMLESTSTISGRGTITINNCEFSHNGGAGTLVSDGALTVMNSTFSENLGISGHVGGGIVFGGTAVVKHSEFLNNDGVLGGGAFVVGNSAVLTLENTTISGNSAWRGGGILNAGTVIATNSLITGNTALSVEEGFGGGGIYQTDTASLTLVRTDVIGNTPNDIWPIQ